MGNSFVGCIVYADDISLVSPIASGLQDMLDVCGHFTKDNLLKFNIRKSAVTVFTCMKRRMGGVCAEVRRYVVKCYVPVTKNLTYLGIVARFDGKNTSPVQSRVQKFYAAANAAMGKLGQKTILERQLLSYGCHLWRLNNKSVRDAVNTAW